MGLLSWLLGKKNTNITTTSEAEKPSTTKITPQPKVDSLMERIEKLKRSGDIDGLNKIAEELYISYDDPKYEWKARGYAEELSRSKGAGVEKLKEKEDVEGLIKVLSHSDSGVIREATLALGKIYKKVTNDQKSSIIKALADALKDKHGYVRQAAAQQLRWIKPDDPVIVNDIVIPALVETLSDIEDYVRQDAASALSKYGFVAIPALSKVLENDNEMAFCEAAWAISDITDHGRALDEKMHKALLPAIESLKKVIQAATILPGARSYGSSVARAIGTLGEIGDRSVIPSLESLLEKVQKKITGEGVEREYVNTGIVAGYISSSDNVSHIERAINEIKEREKV